MHNEFLKVNDLREPGCVCGFEYFHARHSQMTGFCVSGDEHQNLVSKHVIYTIFGVANYC
jgi:hypothetical protein